MRVVAAFLLYLVGVGAQVWAAEALVAVAANFLAPVQRIAEVFTTQTGHSIQVVAGSTGKLYAQIRHGAPFEVLLAADAATPRRLAQEGYAIDVSQFTYAVGELVLWSRDADVVDADGQVLWAGDADHLAVANPNVSPYGAAAFEALSNLNVLPRWRDHVVQGENIGQAYQFVASGNAELGFVAASQVFDDGELRAGSVWVVPERLYQPIHQDAILLRRGQDNPAATAFLSFLQGEQARAIVRSFGYGVPQHAHQ